MVLLALPSNDPLLSAPRNAAHPLLCAVSDAPPSPHRHLRTSDHLTSLPGRSVGAAEALRLHVLHASRVRTLLAPGAVGDAASALDDAVLAAGRNARWSGWDVAGSFGLAQALHLAT